MHNDYKIVVMSESSLLAIVTATCFSCNAARVTSHLVKQFIQGLGMYCIMQPSQFLLEEFNQVLLHKDELVLSRNVFK